ncbi:hypothetical protein ACQY0O_005026 [Thecaphora frezii]
MVFVVKEAPQRKSRLSLFRIGKSSKNQEPATPSPVTPRADSDPLASLTSPVSSSSPTDARGAAPRRAPRAMQEASLPGYKGTAQPMAFSFQPNQEFKLGSDFPSEGRPDVPQHGRSSSLPLEPTRGNLTASTSPVHIYASAETREGLLRRNRHARQRSHFSIPDVVITACEEEGETVHVELEVAPDMRRSYVFANQATSRASKKHANGTRRKPTPLIDLGEENEGAMVSSSPSLSSLNDSPSWRTTGTNSPSSPMTPVSSASASHSKTTSSQGAGKRIRKSSFPLLFGKKSSDPARAAKAEPPLTDAAMPMTPHSPTGGIEPHVVYSGQYESAVSLPSSSKESLPGGTPPPRGENFKPNAGLPSPPETPVLSSRPLTKRELKAREKEELSLIKELERIDKMVRDHDLKAKKAAEKSEAKERKRAAKRASSGFMRITIFSAASKAGPKANVGRRNSLARNKRETLIFEDRPAGRHRSSGSSGVAVGGRVISPTQDQLHRFAPQPSASQQQQQRRWHQGAASRRTMPDSPTRATRHGASAVTEGIPEVDEVETFWSSTRADSQKNSEELDQSTWRSHDWSGLDPSQTSAFPSLVRRDELQQAPARPPPPPSSYRFPFAPSAATAAETAAAAIKVTERDPGSPPLSNPKRRSVQRVLALADAEEVMLRKRNSLRRRCAAQPQPAPGKRSSRLGSSGGRSSKRSSVASDPRRRSFIRQLDALEGWEVADPSELDIARPDLDMSEWVDSIESARLERQASDSDVDHSLPSSASAMMHEMMHVDLVLKDLQAAQASAATDAEGASLAASLGSRADAGGHDPAGFDDGQSTPRASGIGAQRPDIPTISFTPASIDSGLDQIAALGSPIRTKSSSPPSVEAPRRFSRPAKSQRRSESSSSSSSSSSSASTASTPAYPVGARSVELAAAQSSFARPFSPETESEAERGSYAAGSPPTTSSTSPSSSSSSPSSSPTTSATTTFSLDSSPVSPSSKNEYRLSMKPFRPIELFGIELGGIASGLDE